MPPRIRPQELARLLDRVAQPVYVVDDEGCIVYVNASLAEWAGMAADQLAGQSCRFYSGPAAPDEAAVANLLCPPPAALAGTEISAEITLTSTAGAALRRNVRFLPLAASDQGVIGVLALAGELLADEPAAVQTTAVKSEARLLHEQIQRLRHRFRQPYHIDQVLGATPAMARVRAQAALAAQTDANVMIVGPPGSGREHVARAIHAADTCRSADALVPFACEIVGGELLRSSVAALLRRGLGTNTQNATLLLNNVDRLPPADQADLPSLLAAASGKLRILSTARTSLVELAQRGEFLSAAAFQLSTLSLELPPLAARLSDLPLLAQLFLERANALGQKQVGGFSEDALDLLAAYPWSNDLDELEQVVREAHAACSSTEVTAADLPAAVRHARHAQTHPRQPDEPIVLDGLLGRIELELIQRALAQSKGNKSKAAQLLGLNRPRLYRRLVQLGLVDAVEMEDAGDAAE